MAEPIIINNFDAGIADSPHKGFGLMRNVELDPFPGAIKVQKATTTLFHTALSATFTANASTDVCTLGNGTTPPTGTAVKPTTTTTLPAGLTANTVYFIINISSTTFKLATTIANANSGTAVDITDAGTGTHTITTVNPGQINHIIRDPRLGTYFLQDSNGRVWFSTSYGTTALLLNNSVLDNAQVGSAALANASGNGIVLFQNSNSTAVYLLSFRNAVIDIINVFASTNLNTPSWTNAWNFGGASSDTALNTGAGVSNRHHAVVGQDNIIYFTDAKYVGSIQELAGKVFDPTDTTTYSGNDQALDLPNNEIAQHLEELGVNLLIAGNNTNKIYPWDRVSDSFNNPILVPEIQVSRLKNIGNLVYILAGTRGYIYYTQGTYVKLFKKIPDQVANNSGTLLSNPVTWGGIGAVDGKLVFGAGVQTSGNSGVYMVYPDGRMIIDQVPSTGSANATAIYASDSFYLFGYSGGADSLSTSSLYTNFNTVVQSMLYKVGTKTGKGKLSLLEVQAAKPASSGHIRISYRTDTSSSFTTLDTYTADGTSTSFKTDIGLIDLENIQLQAEMDGSFELIEIRLYP